MKIFIVLVLLIKFSCFSGVRAQQHSDSLGSSLFLSAGKSFSGTGDAGGVYILSGFSKNYKRWHMAIEVATTMYNDYSILLFTNPQRPSEMIDGSIRNDTYGIQLNLIGSYRILKKAKHNFNVGVGPMLRYQSTSIPDGNTVLFPALTGLPVPVLYFDHREAQNTYAVGGILKLAYTYQVCKKITAGAAFSFQMDTNEDTISNLGFSVGYVL